jgi:hypothetical protein
MNLTSRLVVVPVFSLQFFACTPDEPTPIEPPISNEQCPLEPCGRNIDCAAGAICEKDEGAALDDVGCCRTVLCLENADCRDDHVCAPDTGLCNPANPCVPGTQEGCENGTWCRAVGDERICVDFPAGTASCFVEPAHIVLAEGDVASFAVLALDANGGPQFTTTATFDTSIGTVTSAGRTATVTAGPCSSPPCIGVLSATTGPAACEATVVVLSVLAPGDFRVSLTDRNSHAALENVDVVVQRATGAPVIVATDSNGVATFAGVVPADVVAVSVFDDAHAWLTVLAPTTADLALSLAPLDVQTPLVSAVKGEIGVIDPPGLGDILTTYSGFAPRGALVDVDFRKLYGPLVPTMIDIEGVTDGAQTAFMPFGQTMKLGNDDLKPRFVALAPSQQTLLFTIGGRIRLADVGPWFSAILRDEVGEYGTDLFVTEMMTRFAHGFTVVDPTTTTAPADLFEPGFDDATLDVPDVAVNATTGHRRTVDLDLPMLPCPTPLAFACATDQRMEGVLALVGFDVPRFGFVPTGMRSFVDEMFGAHDGFIGERQSAPEGNPDLSRASVWGAFAHDGLEGLPARAVIVARDGGVLFANDDGPVSAMQSDLGADSLSVGFSSEGFMATPTAAFASPTIVTPVAPGAGRVDVVRLRLTSEDGAAWEILSPDARAVDLAALRSELAVERASRGHVTMLRLGGVQPTYASLMARGGKGLARVDAHAQAWARAPIARP